MDGWPSNGRKEVHCTLALCSGIEIQMISVLNKEFWIHWMEGKVAGGGGEVGSKVW